MSVNFPYVKETASSVSTTTTITT